MLSRDTSDNEWKEDFVRLACRGWYTHFSFDTKNCRSRYEGGISSDFSAIIDRRPPTRMFTTGYWNECCLSYFIGYIAIRPEFWYGRAACRFDNSLPVKPRNRYFKQTRIGKKKENNIAWNLNLFLLLWKRTRSRRNCQIQLNSYLVSAAVC